MRMLYVVVALTYISWNQKLRNQGREVDRALNDVNFLLSFANIASEMVLYYLYGLKFATVWKLNIFAVLCLLNDYCWKWQIPVYAILYNSIDICHYIILFTLYYVVNILAHGIYETHLPLFNIDKEGCWNIW